MKIISRILLIVLGILCLILGVVGVFVPILPTTPLLLLAAFCFVRSSGRFYLWLIHNRLFGAYIRNYREGLGISLKHKLLTMLLLWLSIGYAAIFVVTPWWGKLLLLGVALGVSLHLALIKTFQPVIENSKDSLLQGRRIETDG